MTPVPPNVKISLRRGGWGNRVSPRPRPAGELGNPVAPFPHPREGLGGRSPSNDTSPSLTLPRRGREPGSSPQRGEAGRGAATRFPHAPARGRAWPSSRGMGKPGFPIPHPVGGFRRAAPSQEVWFIPSVCGGAAWTARRGTVWGKCGGLRPSYLPLVRPGGRKPSDKRLSAPYWPLTAVHRSVNTAVCSLRMAHSRR